MLSICLGCFGFTGLIFGGLRWIEIGFGFGFGFGFCFSESRESLGRSSSSWPEEEEEESENREEDNNDSDEEESVSFNRGRLNDASYEEDKDDDEVADFELLWRKCLRDLGFVVVVLVVDDGVVLESGLGFELW